MLSRCFRLKKKELTSSIYKKSEGHASRYFVVHTLNNQLGHPRFAIAVSRKILKSSVKRNFKRRQIYAMIHHGLKETALKTFSKDYIISLRAPALSLPYYELQKEFQHLALSSHFSSNL